MPENYTQALINLAAKTSPKEAADALVKNLEMRGRAKLLPRIAHALSRAAEKAAAQPEEVLVVAREKDAAHAHKASSLPEAKVLVDPTIVGGWQARKGSTLTDASFKKQLKDLFNRVTA